MRFHYGRPNTDDDFSAIVSRTNDLLKLTRSTVPLLAWWRDNYARIAPAMDFENANAYFEYSVAAGCATCGGKGKASMTDVMVLAEDRAFAIEAKYTESKYESVDKWKTSGDAKNREKVLAHWCHLIEQHTSAPIDPVHLGPLVYQTVHRTASACAAAGARRAAEVVYLVFSTEKTPDYFGSLSETAAILDREAKIQFTLTEVPTTPEGAAVDGSRRRCRRQRAHRDHSSRARGRHQAL